MGDGGGGGGSPIRRPLRVVLVDDDHDARELLERVFSRHGFECRVADSVAAAMEILASYVPDVIISDLSMPDEDGFSFIKRLRSLASPCASLPAIALTALSGPHHRKAALDSGFDLYLMKPAHPEVLSDAAVCLAQSRGLSHAS